MAALVLTVYAKSTTLSHQQSLTAPPEPWDDLDMLKSLGQWAREVFYEARLRICSRSNMFDGWHNVEIFCNLPLNHGQLYVTIPSERNDFEPRRELAVHTLLIYCLQLLRNAWHCSG